MPTVGVGLGLTSSGFNGGLEVTDIVKNGPVARNGRLDKEKIRWICFFDIEPGYNLGLVQVGLATGERDVLRHTSARPPRKHSWESTTRRSAPWGCRRRAGICSESESRFACVQGQTGRHLKESERGGGRQQHEGEGAFAGRGWHTVQPDVPPARRFRCVSFGPLESA